MCTQRVAQFSPGNPLDVNAAQARFPFPFCKRQWPGLEARIEGLEEERKTWIGRRAVPGKNAGPGCPSENLRDKKFEGPVRCQAPGRRGVPASSTAEFNRLAGCRRKKAAGRWRGNRRRLKMKERAAILPPGAETQRQQPGIGRKPVVAAQACRNQHGTARRDPALASGPVNPRAAGLQKPERKIRVPRLQIARPFRDRPAVGEHGFNLDFQGRIARLLSHKMINIYKQGS